jgi:hypothetical protein
MTRVLDTRSFSGKIYVIAEYADGNIYHFYDAARVTDWDTIADGNCDVGTLADYLAVQDQQFDRRYRVFGGRHAHHHGQGRRAPFTISGAAVNGGVRSTTQTVLVTTVQANVAAVAEVARDGQLSDHRGHAIASASTAFQT